MLNPIREACVWPVIVTVGTHAIGRACVEHLAREGKRVLFVGRDNDAGSLVESARDPLCVEAALIGLTQALALEFGEAFVPSLASV